MSKAKLRSIAVISGDFRPRDLDGLRVDVVEIHGRSARVRVMPGEPRHAGEKFWLPLRYLRFLSGGDHGAT